MRSPSPTPHRWTPLLLIVLALVVAWPAALSEFLLPPAAHAVAPGGNGRIIFVSSTVTPEHPEGEPGIFSMSADGSGRRLLTGDGVTFEHETIGLAISPDGRQIAFSDDTQDIHLMDVDGSNPRRITTGLFSYGPLAWSPDGSKIAYIQVGARHDIWVMNTDGSNRTLLTNNASSINTRPDWSPDGTRIVYEANPPGGGLMGIWVMDANGANSVRIATTGDDPSWSPDGKRIAFTRGGDLYTIKPDGTDEARVTHPPEFDANVTWAPAGNRLLFTTDSAQGGADLFTIKPDGTGRQQLTHDGLSITAVWQSGTSVPIRNPPKVVQHEALVFSSNRVTAENPEGDFEIFLLEMDPLAGDVVTQLTSNTSPDVDPKWSPDGGQIAFTCDTTICTMNADGSNSVRLTFPAAPNADSLPEWSPSGDRIAFSRGSAPAALYTVRTDGSGLAQLALLGDSTAAQWSPDGVWLAFTVRISGLDRAIYRINRDGTNLIRLADIENLAESVPRWSPDGSTIAFVKFGTDASGGYQLFVMDDDGGNLRQLTSGHANSNVAPAWSPDGSLIAFGSVSNSGSGSKADIVTIKPDGTGRVTRTRDPKTLLGELSWSADSKKIGFTDAPPSGETDIFTMKANGSNEVNRTASPRSDAGADWRPASQSQAAAGRGKDPVADDPRHRDNAADRPGDAGKSPNKAKAKKQREKRQRERKQDQQRKKHHQKHKHRAKQRQRAGEERDAPRRSKARTRRRTVRAAPD